MKLGLQRPIDQFVATGGQLGLLAFAAILQPRDPPSPAYWAIVLALIAGLSLYGWLLALRRRRAIIDTPTAKIGTAAQGYVELTGTGRRFDGQPLLSRLTGLPCLWYRYRVEEKGANDKWRVVQQGESDDSILVEDATGIALVDPAGAEIVTRHRQQWHAGEHRMTEWKLLIGDPLYVLGDFRTVNAAGLPLDAHTDTRELLGEWKRAPDTLRQRFDLDGDGQIDLREWSLARSAARREVARRHREERAAADAHLVHAPADGRPYLIANIDPERLARRFGWWSLLHVIVFVAALGAIPWTFTRLS